MTTLTCALGHTYTLDEWRTLPLVGIDDEYDADRILTIRRCAHCSTTVSREHKLLHPSYIEVGDILRALVDDDVDALDVIRERLRRGERPTVTVMRATDDAEFTDDDPTMSVYADESEAIERATRLPGGVKTERWILS